MIRHVIRQFAVQTLYQMEVGQLTREEAIENIELIGKALKKGKHKGEAMITAYDKKTGEIVGEVAVEMNITSE